MEFFGISAIEPPACHSFLIWLYGPFNLFICTNIEAGQTTKEIFAGSLFHYMSPLHGRISCYLQEKRPPPSPPNILWSGVVVVWNPVICGQPNRFSNSLLFHTPDIPAFSRHFFLANEKFCTDFSGQ